MRVVVALAAALISGAAVGQPAIDARPILEIERIANGACRGGSGDRPETEIACQIRDDVIRRLRDIGWCYGEVGQIGAQMQWHRCNRRSNQMQVH